MVKNNPKIIFTIGKYYFRVIFYQLLYVTFSVVFKLLPSDRNSTLKTQIVQNRGVFYH